MCESGDHVTLSRRCSERVYSPDPACLPKFVAPRAAYRFYLFSDGATLTLASSQAVAGRPLMCESVLDHVLLSRRCSVRVYSPDLACLSKVMAARAAYSSHLFHQGCSQTAASSFSLFGDAAEVVIQVEWHVGIRMQRRLRLAFPLSPRICLVKARISWPGMVLIKILLLHVVGEA